MPPSGLLRRVALVRTDVSEERIAFIIRVTRVGGLGTLAVTSNRSMLFTRVTWHTIPEDNILQKLIQTIVSLIMDYLQFD
jgi:hypothetical protein